MSTIKVDEGVLSVLNSSAISLQDSISRLNKTIGGKKKRLNKKNKKNNKQNTKNKKNKKSRKHKI